MLKKSTGDGAGRRPHVLIIVENFSVPADRRVWQQSTTLVDAGFDVTVISPMGDVRDREARTEIDGVQILRYPLSLSSGRLRGYIHEYGAALWHSLRLALWVRRQGPVDVVQACNPPDILFLVALALRPRGTRFVFDHHDLVPELIASRFPGRHPLLVRMARWAERLTFRCADAVISTNDTYRQIAIDRGGVDPAAVTVVRNGPDLTRFTRQPVDETLRRGKAHLLAYVGVMGPQDGVDYAVRAIAALRHELHREDFHCVFMGSGDEYDAVVDLAGELGVSDMIEFTGWVGDEVIKRCLSSADVCLAPDPLSPLNAASTTIKIPEYLAMGKPVVSFDLPEARVSAGDAACYVPPNDVTAFAKAIDALLEDAALRYSMGEVGRRRVEEELSWNVSRRRLVRFYRELTAVSGVQVGHTDNT